MNDKEVTQFLRRYKNIHSSPIQQPQIQQINMHKLIIEISATIKTIYRATQELMDMTKHHQIQMNKELETVKASKGKYSTFQNYQDQNTAEIQEKLLKLQQYCDNQVDKLQSTYYDSQEQQTEILTEQISTKMEKQLEDQFKKLKEIIERKHNQQKGITKDVEKEIKKPKKLIIIPNNPMEITQISKILREETKSTGEKPEISKIRKTRNNNIEIKTTEDEVETLATILKKQSEDFELINPEE